LHYPNNSPHLSIPAGGDLSQITLNRPAFRWLHQIQLCQMEVDCTFPSAAMHLAHLLGGGAAARHSLKLSLISPQRATSLPVMADRPQKT
jgi:hypothetical protein